MAIQFKGQVSRKDIEKGILKSWLKPRKVMKTLLIIFNSYRHRGFLGYFFL